MFGTKAEINLDALRANVDNFKTFLPAHVKLAGVIKANAYGHDLKTVAKVLEGQGVDYIAVANVREAVAVRRVCPHMPILVMGYTSPTDYDLAVKHDVTLTMFKLEDMRALNLNASYDNKIMKIHIKYDTGFNRLGYKDRVMLVEDVKQASSFEWLEIEGIFTHLALKDAEHDALQMKAFDQVLQALRQEGIHVPIAHVCDTIGAALYPKAPYQMVRIGAGLFGYCNRPLPFELKPVMNLKTNISHLKWLEAGEGVSYDGLFETTQRTCLATLPIGYADGLPRNMHKGGYVSIRGVHAPIVGLICMDQCMVDVTGIESVRLGDEVVIFGDDMPLLDVAQIAATNRNELLSRVALRVPRVIIEQGEQSRIIDYLLDEA